MFSQILKGFALASALLVLIGASPATAAEHKLLSKSDVIELAANLLGADPWSQPHREDALNAIRDIIKTVGVDFRYSLALDNEMGARGLADHRIADAIAENFGPHPQLDAYYGVFLVGDFKPGRVVHDVVDGTTLYRAQEHSAPLGILIISQVDSGCADIRGLQAYSASTPYLTPNVPKAGPLRG